MNNAVSLPHNRLVLAALAGSILLASLGISIAAVALPTLSRAFAASVEQVQWVMLAYLLAVTATIVPAGRLGDLHGHRRVLMAGIALFTLASAAAALAPGLGWLTAARVAQGLGAAVLMSLPMSLAKGLVAQERMGAAMGLLGTMSAIGTALGPSVGGLLIGSCGWRAAFALLTVLGAGLLALAWAALPAARANAAAARAPLALGLLRDRAVATPLAMNLLVGAVMMATLVVGPFFLAFGLGLTEAQTGLVMAAGPIAAALSGVPAGRLTDRLGTQACLRAGLALATAGLCGFALLPAVMGVPGYVLALMLVTPGFQLFLAGNNTAMMRAAPEAHKGLLSGLLGLSRNLGFMLGAALLPLLFSALLGADGLARSSRQALGQAFATTFLVAAGLCLLSLLLALRGKAVHSSQA
ncbi:MFS transporter [Acidovorax sp. CCYZU-2555]|uniref:MFS transporter n=1 Tax=Acidovorax sp. CCYZU-2555 TaxID=2835042 RepID=UPI0020BDEF56|nr:MFS transporter [Acidovorax sp. CCYZU-2555]